MEKETIQKGTGYNSIGDGFFSKKLRPQLNCIKIALTILIDVYYLLDS